MKGKIKNEQEKPWYVRVEQYLLKEMDSKPTAKENIRDMLIVIAISFIVGTIGYGISYLKSTIPYEQAYDVEYNAYVNERLEQVADEVLDETIGIILGKIPQFVSKYEIKYEKERIDFNYWLDQEQIISDYFSEICLYVDFVYYFD